MLNIQYHHKLNKNIDYDKNNSHNKQNSTKSYNMIYILGDIIEDVVHLVVAEEVVGDEPDKVPM